MRDADTHQGDGTMRKVVMRNADHQDISTGLAAFDRQTTALGTGNIIGGTQLGGFVRSAFLVVDPVGRPCPVGAIQDYDLRGFSRHLSPRILADIRRHTPNPDDQVCLHMFFHGSGAGKTVHGFVLTRDHEHMYELLETYVTGPTNRSRGVIETAAEYVSNPPGTDQRLDAAGAAAFSALAANIGSRARDPEATARAARTVEVLERVVESLASDPDGVRIGPRVLLHLAHEDVAIAPRTEGQAAAAAAAMEIVAPLDRDARHSLASALIRLNETMLKGMPDMGSEFSAKMRALRGGLAYRAFRRAEIEAAASAPRM